MVCNVKLMSSIAVLNFSTSSQISFICCHEDVVIPPSCNIRTYFHSIEGQLSHDGRQLVVASSLNGGNVLTFFVKTLFDWIGQFDLDISQEMIWSKITLAANNENWSSADDPVVRPAIYGERYDPKVTESPWECRNTSHSDLQLAHCHSASFTSNFYKHNYLFMAKLVDG